VTSTSFSFIDLFAGIGGMRIGFESAGGACVLTCEIDDYAMETYRLNHSPGKGHKYVGDILSLKSNEIPKHDVLVAGFPCQPYSIAGLRKGLQDDRGAVFMEIIRILKDKKPKSFLLENVKGIMAHDKGATFDYMLSLLEGIGYHMRYQVLNSMEHANIPQNRERVFIVGFLNLESAKAFEFPKKMKLSKTIHSALEKRQVDSRFYYDDRFDCYDEIKKSVVSGETVYQWRQRDERRKKRLTRRHLHPDPKREP